METPKSSPEGQTPFAVGRGGSDFSLEMVRGEGLRPSVVFGELGITCKRATLTFHQCQAKRPHPSPGPYLQLQTVEQGMIASLVLLLFGLAIFTVKLEACIGHAFKHAMTIGSQ